MTYYDDAPVLIDVHVFCEDELRDHNARLTTAAHQPSSETFHPPTHQVFSTSQTVKTLVSRLLEEQQGCF